MSRKKPEPSEHVDSPYDAGLTVAYKLNVIIAMLQHAEIREAGKPDDDGGWGFSIARDQLLELRDYLRQSAAHDDARREAEGGGR